MKERLISSIIGIPIVIFFLFTSKEIFLIFIILVSLIAILEWINFVKLHWYLKLFWILIYIVILLFLIKKAYFNFDINENVKKILAISWIFNIFWLIVFLFLFHYSFLKKFIKKSNILFFIFGIFIIGSFLWSILILRQYHYNIQKYEGSKWLLYIISLVWGTDCGAYFFGKLFGKTKFIFQISPQKTIEGICGGMIFSILIALFFVLFEIFKINIYIFIILSIVISFASILGDLTESMFKRIVGIKDSGCIIPGHGGILDRIDSLTAAIPIALNFLFIFKIFIL